MQNHLSVIPQGNSWLVILIAMAHIVCIVKPDSEGLWGNVVLMCAPGIKILVGIILEK